MHKREAIEQLRAAKSAHIQWRSYAQALVAGIPLDESKVPVAHTDCRFGKWYYGSGQHLARLPAFDAIGGPHETLHQIYMRIFTCLFGEDHRSTLRKLFGSSRKHRAEKIAEAEVLLKQLVGVSETLLEALRLLEDEIRGMSDEEVATLV